MRNCKNAERNVIVCSHPADDPEYLEIAQLFLSRLKTQLAAMRDASARNDDVELARLAHWLKGSGGTAGFDAFTQPAHELGLAAKSRQRPRYRPLIRHLADLADRIEIQVRT